MLIVNSYDYTKGKLNELIQIIIDSGAKLFVCAVGVPPKFVVEKLHKAGVLYMNMIGHPKHVQKCLDLGVDMRNGARTIGFAVEEVEALQIALVEMKAHAKDGLALHFAQQCFFLVRFGGGGVVDFDIVRTWPVSSPLGGLGTPVC